MNTAVDEIAQDFIFKVFDPLLYCLLQIVKIVILEMLMTMLALRLLDMLVRIKLKVKSHSMTESLEMPGQSSIRSSYRLLLQKVVSIKFIVVSVGLINLSACSTLGVEPWQRDVLSQPDMQFGSANLTSTLSQHFYFSKEASSGGQGFAGGGCGCN